MDSNNHITRERMDKLADAHFRAEQQGDIPAIVAGFADDAEHDVAGRPGEPLHGSEQIAAFYRGLLADLKIDRFEPVRRWYGHDHLVDESILHATAIGQPFGLDGRGQHVRTRLLHVFEFSEDRITRESAWLDLAGMAHQLQGHAISPTAFPCPHSGLGLAARPRQCA
jgi:ketosteroid isomerase-like protein